MLRGEQTIAFRQDSEKPKKKKTKAVTVREKTAGAAPDDVLWQALKNKRLELAREQNVPPYVIFHDSTLSEIHKIQPKTLEELATISGVGQHKLQHYGSAFIEVILKN